MNSDLLNLPDADAALKQFIALHLNKEEEKQCGCGAALSCIGHPNGAEAGATFYSLVETAKANGLEPYNYLRHIFEKLPLTQTDQGYKNLLPQFVDGKDLFAYLS